MEWQYALVLIMGGLLVLMMSGMPVAFCFMLINMIGVYLFWGGQVGLEQLITSIAESVASFTILPVPLFILMGEFMFHSGVAPQMMDAVDRWLGRMPGRLGLIAVGGGTLFGFLSGASMASCAMLGSVLVPEMLKRGYKKPMILGPIMGSAGLDVLIPPSGTAVILCAIGEISVGETLLGITVPGLVLAAIIAAYIIIVAKMRPDLAPPYDVPPTPLREKIRLSLLYIVPIGLVIFLVLGVILVGVATPTEAAATGAIGTFILAACYRKLTWEAVKKSVVNTFEISVMLFFIICGAKAFSQILAFSGATKNVSQLALNLPLPPLLVVGMMMVITLFLGMFITGVSMMMITVPIFLPVIYALKFSPVWFAVLMVLSGEIGGISPPFGMTLFVMKGVAPPGTTMGEVYKSAIPYCYLNLIAMVLIMAFPAIALWLPSLMRH